MSTLMVPLMGKHELLPSTTGKRSRSNSVSSTSSSTSSSHDGSSIFSQSNPSSTEDAVSNFSSPSSSKSSPASSAYTLSEDERPTKSLRTAKHSIGPLQGGGSQGRKTVEEEEAALATLGEKCSLKAEQSSNTVAAKKEDALQPPSPPVLQNANKSLFVDCLVDATVHVLNMIWHAPVHRSIAFLDNARTALSVKYSDEAAACQCPIGAPLAGGIPLDLFIRETLRRSRTSCSTLQAALLYCKRVGAEVVRRRAESAGVKLSPREQTILEGRKRGLPSLTQSVNASNAGDVLPQVIANDPILCSRRTFLAAIMVSSKFLQDRTFSNRAWSKISGLNVKELGLVERRMLDAIEFDLYVHDAEWQIWTRYLKGEWKSSLDTCSCQETTHLMETLGGAIADVKPIRKVFERTASLSSEPASDLEVASRSDIGLCTSSHDSTDTLLATPNAISSPSGESTPTQAPSSEVLTPTKRVPQKAETSLLATAVTNSIFGALHVSASNSAPGMSASKPLSTASVALTVDSPPLPFPFRKGLTARSFSSQ